jgi:hypothetical protein
LAAVAVGGGSGDKGKNSQLHTNARTPVKVPGADEAGLAVDVLDVPDSLF